MKSQGRKEHPKYNKTKKADWTGHTVRRNRLLKHVIEGEIEGTRRRRRTHKRILDDRKETRKY